MKLLTITLRNFKGVRNFTLDGNGGNVSIFGDNATGKTTLYDAFLWLLFDKDSQNKKDFGIKTRDASGNELHNLEHEVAGTFEINGRTVTLKKLFKEKWVKQRGKAESEFSGHVTSYWIDDVPKPKKDYDAFISGIVAEDIFKLLTSPSFFNEQLHWQERRKILMEICGDISDQDVINSDQSLKDLTKILNGRTLDDFRKIVAARRAVINKELDKIPVRIDEVSQGLPDVSGVPSREMLAVEIKSLKQQQQEKQKEIIRIQNGGEIAEQQKKISEIDIRIQKIQAKHRSETTDKVFAKKTEQQNIQLCINDIKQKIGQKQNKICSNDAVIKNVDSKLDDLRKQWYAEDSKEFVFEQETVCPTCGHELPESKLEAARENALAQFNIEISKKLSEINETGKKIKADAEQRKIENDALSSEINALNVEKDALDQKIKALQSEIDTMNAEIRTIDTNPEYQKAVSEKAAIQEKITAIQGKQQSVIDGLQSEVNMIGQDIAARERKMSLLDQYAQGQKRIDELTAQQKELGKEFETLEGQLYLADQFIRAKVNMLERRINSKFKVARFKLFNQQINGGLEETCVTTYNGVPYDAGLNNAARINVGLDIINTLSEHYNFTAPIFIDNAESVTQIAETTSQAIRMVVSQPDKELRVVHDTAILKEAV